MKRITFLLYAVFTILNSQHYFAQDSLSVSTDISINRHIDGTLLIPESNKPLPLAIIIAGSGPTDRNGNQNLMQNNSLKKLAIGLSENNIATFRYDKRVVKQIKTRNVSS